MSWNFLCLDMFPCEGSKTVSVCLYPEKRYNLSFANISLTLVIDTSMERSSWVLKHGNRKFEVHEIKIASRPSRKTKNILTNIEAWILNKLQCVVYQWIRLNELYKLLERFFNVQFVFKFLAENGKNPFFSNRGVNINQIAIFYVSMDSYERTLQTNEKLFQILNWFLKFRLKTKNFGQKPKNIQKNS